MQKWWRNQLVESTIYVMTTDCSTNWNCFHQTVVECRHPRTVVRLDKCIYSSWRFPYKWKYLIFISLSSLRWLAYDCHNSSGDNLLKDRMYQADIYTPAQLMVKKQSSSSQWYYTLYLTDDASLLLSNIKLCRMISAVWNLHSGERQNGRSIRMLIYTTSCGYLNIDWKGVEMML